jgi:hypothetical protein
MSKWLSENDYSQYTTFLNRVQAKTKKRLETILSKYKGVLQKKDTSTQIKITEKATAIIQDKISSFLLKFPQDIGLSKKDNEIFMFLSLVQLELQRYAYELNQTSIQFNTMNFVCDNGGKNFTVYKKNYCVDDMCFVVWNDEIHVTDGQFLLPNFNATRMISASGEKFDGTNTETKEAVTFWFKWENMSYFVGNTLKSSCAAAYE